MYVTRLTSNATNAVVIWPNLEGVRVLPGMALEYIEYFNCPVGEVAVSELSARLTFGLDVAPLADSTGRRSTVVSVAAGKARAGRWRRVIVSLERYVGRLLTDGCVTLGARLSAPSVYPVTTDFAELTLTRYRQNYMMAWRSGLTAVSGGVLATRELDTLELPGEESTSTEDPVSDITFVRALAGNARGRTRHDQMRNDWVLSASPLTAEETADLFTFYWLYREEPFLYSFEPTEPPRVALFRDRPTKRELDTEGELRYRVQLPIGEA
jgi:hypothetical protein